MVKKPDIEHINYAIISHAHTPMYLIHKYWARKPHNVVSQYIRHYSKEGEIVLDPFAGSGVTAMEAVKAGRKAVSIDLNPMSAFLVENTLSQVSPQDIEAEFRKIEAKLKDKINGLYETKCPKCGKTIIAICLHWDGRKPVKVMFECETCNTKTGKEPEKFDLRKAKDAGELKPKWHPQTRLAYNGNFFKEGARLLKAEGKDTLYALFTERNLYALSILFAEIEKIKDKRLKGVFAFAFTSMLHLASKMTPVRPTRLFSSFWAIHSYWTPPVYMESNVWMLFESAVLGKQGVLKGKDDAARQVTACRKAKNFKELHDGADLLVETMSALELTKRLPRDSVDYIFTDPPYGGAIQYFELSTLWAAWLNIDLNYGDEITVNSQQQKNFDYYHKMLKAAFREMYLILKPGRYLTVTFHSTEIRVWNSILKAVVLSGFDLEKIVFQPPARPSAKGLLQPYGSAVGDYYLRFKKPETTEPLSEREIDNETYERDVVRAAAGIIKRRGQPTIYQHILNSIMVDLKGGRNVPVGARNIEDVLKDHVGKEFELIDHKDPSGRKTGKMWWLRDRDLTALFAQPSLTDRVEKVVLEVLDKKIKASFDDILQEVFILFPNAMTPDAKDVAAVLEEYAGRTPDGNWTLKPGLQEGNRESIHNLMIYRLARLGKAARFKVWIGLQEQKFKVEGKPLSEMCDEIPYWRHFQDDKETLDRVKQIDVVWLNGDGIVCYEFEVENTTGISEAMIRGSFIPEMSYLRRFIVIPRERERFLFRKLQAPVLVETMKKTKWNFIRYDDLENVAKAAGKTFDPIELEAVARMPKDSAPEKQLSLLEDRQT